MPHDFAYPRPEYPRPDRQRGTLEGVDWLNLNGPWQFRFDPDRRGEEKGWHSASDVEWREQRTASLFAESPGPRGEGEEPPQQHSSSTPASLDSLRHTRPHPQPRARSASASLRTPC